MRKSITLLALGATLASSAALAQVSVGGRVGVGANVRVDTGRTLDHVRGTLDRTVERTDRAVNRELRRDRVVATRADVRAGVVVRDRSGHRVGTVQSMSGGSVLVVQGNRAMWVPLASLYRSSNGLVTDVSRARLRASAETRADANARVHY